MRHAKNTFRKYKTKYLIMAGNYKVYFLFFSLFILLIGCESESIRAWIDGFSGASISSYPEGNSFFHEQDVIKLKKGNLYVGGEVNNPGNINFRKIYKREVVVKESIPIDDDLLFIGAFRYIGYSLFDILHHYIVDKLNADIFTPHVDLYIIISNEKDESVVFSWSEIFHTSIPHQIILAIGYAPIVPGKKEVNYDPGETWKIVAASDFYALRNIENPTKIEVSSFNQKQYKIDRDIRINESSELNIAIENGNNYSITCFSEFVNSSYPAVSYGMGMGYRKTDNYSGYTLQSIMQDYIDISDTDRIKNGLVCFAGIDGYRAIYSFSEIFNRIDMVASIIAVSEVEQDIINYRNYLPTDFFIDRSVKSLQEIYFFYP